MKGIGLPGHHVPAGGPGIPPEPVAAHGHRGSPCDGGSGRSGSPSVRRGRAPRRFRRSSESQTDGSDLPAARLAAEGTHVTGSHERRYLVARAPSATTQRRCTRLRGAVPSLRPGQRQSPAVRIHGGTDSLPGRAWIARRSIPLPGSAPFPHSVPNTPNPRRTPAADRARESSGFGRKPVCQGLRTRRLSVSSNRATHRAVGRARTPPDPGAGRRPRTARLRDGQTNRSCSR